ncbi:hypothetical protein PsYK624_078610 [Phanerochaete sordida]|uniref:Uncharacterized protein n=1 Tax=Phanerochaete sordida TaxID=48140 RepID=A0A9P3GBG7_9APHY|nr:hypothetical protein PsYK624_078610 [Phanerochaete sordida]
MGWDEVCVLCGIRNGEAPYYWGGGIKDADDIAKQVHDAGFADLSSAEVSAMLLKIFATTVADADPWYKWTTDPAEAGDCIAIGHFDADYGSYTPCTHHG